MEKFYILNPKMQEIKGLKNTYHVNTKWMALLISKCDRTMKNFKGHFIVRIEVNFWRKYNNPKCVCT